MTYRLTLAVALLATPMAFGDDWPQWMGPKRDNVWYEDGIVEKFPEGGPKKLWSTPLAGGYAGPAVVGDKVYITDYLKQVGETDEGNFQRKETSGTERVYCLDAKTGKELWKHEYPVKYSISYPAGPRCTPLVDGDYVYTLGAEGNLICFEAATGKVVWSKELKTEYGTKSALWGYAAHPFIDGDKLFTLAGGDGSHIVAYNKKTGKELWKAGVAREQGYSPPVIIEAAGVRQMIVPSPFDVRSYDPETGKVYWKVPYEATSGSMIMMPIRYENYLFVAGYSNKNMLLKLATDSPNATVEWKNKKGEAISPVNVQPFGMDGLIYGFDQSGVMYCIDIATGERKWETTDIIGEKARGSETAFIVKNGDRFFFFTEKGDLVIGKLSPEGYKEIDRAKGLIEPTGSAFGRKVVWCMPAFANKKMYVRNDKEIVCFDLAK